MRRMTVIDHRELMRRWLAQRYERQGFAVPKLAKALGVAPTTVGGWIRGQAPVKPKYWETIAAFFGYAQVDQLFDEARTQAETPTVTS